MTKRHINKYAYKHLFKCRYAKAIKKPLNSEWFCFAKFLIDVDNFVGDFALVYDDISVCRIA